MTSHMYTHSVPVFKQLLTALKAIPAQADAHAADKSIEPDALLQARMHSHCAIPQAHCSAFGSRTCKLLRYSSTVLISVSKPGSNAATAVRSPA